MNRINFVGNAIFIPFFLISVGMLVDYRVFFKDFETIKVAIVMTVVATFTKFAAAWLTQKSFKFTKDERRLIFGLSNAQAAATLAAVLVGYNVIIGQTAGGEPIRLLNEAVLNGTIIMILITCTIATFVAQKGAKNISLTESTNSETNETENKERILIPLSNPENIEELINLSLIIKSKENKTGLYALNIINSENALEKDAESKSKKLLEKAIITAAASDVQLNKLLRYDINTLNGISSVIKENAISDLVLGLHHKYELSESFFGNLTQGILDKCETTTFIYKSKQPISTIKRHIIIVPQSAEEEIGFPYWLSRVWNIAKNTGAKLIFFCNSKTKNVINDIYTNYPIDAEFIILEDWDEFLIVSRDIKSDDNIIIILSRKNKQSYHDKMSHVPDYLNKYFQKQSFILVFPIQIDILESKSINLNNPSLLAPITKLDELGKTISRLFKHS
jgi:nucleotide-binding universal stress UspA family protein